jgi:RNA polymerase sigma-70 factor (ECF subfamily)
LLLLKLFAARLRIKGMQNEKQQQEHELIIAIVSGADSYSDLVRRYHVGLIIHCEHLVGNRDDAEDIAQEAFIKAYARLKDFDASKARFSTWLYKIATNEALDYLRRNKRRVDVEDIETVAEVTMPAYIEEDERRYVRKVVSELVPPEYRNAIESYFWDGKSYQQIADDMHVPLNTIRTWIRRAKLQLKEQLS